ncbi:MAG: PKD domain-containing protein, partial [Bacteroidota bacterium]
MKKIYLLLLLSGMFFYSNTFAQVGQGGIPPSFLQQNLNEEIDIITLISPDVNALIQEDETSMKEKDLFRYGVMINTDLNPDNSGTWTELPDGGKIWRLKIKSDGALALGVYYQDFQIPDGSKLFLYNKDKKQIIGAYTNTTNIKGEEFANELIKGDEVTLEYYEPVKVIGELKLNIHGISYAYRPGSFVSAEQKPSEFCEVNIACPEGANWQDEKKGVAVISILIGGSNYICTGSLVNNTSQNCTPYFLSAYHCGEGASASDFNQWVFYFGYEGTSCTATTGYYQVAITGATKKAEAANTPGSKSDMLLLQLNNSNFGTYVPYLNGWSKSTTASASGVSIHHPAGDIKKISTYTSTLTNYYNTHWQVIWAATVTNHGVTEGGSSGSPIFNNTGLVVGTLTGGSSYCTAVNNPDIYGKFSYHWESNGTTSASQLKPWLDPTSTGVTTCAGIYYPCSTTLNANFSGNPTTVAPGGSVVFTDLSTGSPTTWSWSFPGGNPTSSTAQNPTIVYNTVGIYNVSLTVNNGGTPDTETKTGYITVTQPGTGFSMDFEACSDFSTTFTPWTVNDVDASPTFSSSAVDFPNEGTAMAFIAFNASTTTPAWTGNEAHGGSRYGACFGAILPSGGGTGPNNDWLISNQLQLGTSSSLNFWARSITDLYGLERFKIGVSITNNSPGSFTFITPGTYV